MRVVCPSCHAAYEVPAPLLGSEPRRVRCAKCQTVWTADAPAPESLPAEAREHGATEMPGSRAAGIDAAFADAADQRRPDASDHAAANTDLSLADMMRRDNLDAAIAEALPSLGELRPPRARGANGQLSGERRPLAALTKPKRNDALRAVVAWVASLAVLGVCVTAIIVWRGDVARIWPASERLYSALGLR